MDKITSIGSKTAKVTYFFKVVFDNGHISEFEGDYMGHSSEYAPMLVILKDVGDDQFPVAVINSDKIQLMTVRERKDG